MSIVEFFYSNAWNIVIGIGTGIISSIFVSKIFLIYQDVKSDFVEVVKNTIVLERCIIIYQWYCNPKLAQQSHIKLDKDGKVPKEVMFKGIRELVDEEMRRIDGIYKKYMDKKLYKILKKYDSQLVLLNSECGEEYQREECLEKIFDELKETINEYDAYQRKLFGRTLILVIQDKLIILIILLFIAMILIA